MRSGSRSPSSSARRPASDPPSSPVTPTRSPGRAPSRPTSSSSESAHPVTAAVSTSTGPATTSPPAIVVPVSLASSSIPWISSSGSSTSDGSTTDTYASPASAPIAARSDSAVASAFHPMSRSPWVARLKCTPSTSVSIDVTANGRARVTAASSPVQRTSRPLRSASAVSIAAISSSSPTASPDPAPSARQGAGSSAARASARGWVPALAVPVPISVSGGGSGLLGLHLFRWRLVWLVQRRVLVEARVVLLVGLGRGTTRARSVVLARARRAGAGVLAEVGRQLSRVRGRREVVAESAMGGRHERVPDGRGVGASLGARHRDARLRITHPDRRGQLRGVADEPGVLRLVGRARLAGGRAAVVRRGAGAAEDVLVQHLRDLVGLAVGEHPLALRVRQVLTLAIGEHDLLDPGCTVPDPAARQRGVRARHLQRRHAERESA